MVDGTAEKSVPRLNPSISSTAWILRNFDLIAGILPTSASAGDDVDAFATCWMLDWSGRNSKPRTRT